MFWHSHDTGNGESREASTVAWHRSREAEQTATIALLLSLTCGCRSLCVALLGTLHYDSFYVFSWEELCLNLFRKILKLILSGDYLARGLLMPWRPLSADKHLARWGLTPGIFSGYPPLSKLKQCNWCRVNRDNWQNLTGQENRLQIQGLFLL